MTSNNDMHVASIMHINLICNAVQRIQNEEKKKQQQGTLRTRLSFKDYYKLNKDDLYFTRSIRMEASSFQKLVRALKDALRSDEEMGALRGGSVSPSICLFCTIRYLAGGSYLDISSLTGISITAFYTIIWRTIDAIVNCKNPILNNMIFPQTDNECKKAAAGFQSISSYGAITNCVTAIDGYLLAIQTPPAKVVGNVRSYFSGHYQMYGVNVQAACDHLCRFNFIGVAGPGVMSDRDAINQIKLGKLVENLPMGYVAIGDAAYTASEQLAPIYYGRLGKIARYSNYNYYASQCRIRIEMAFGLLKTKWLILNSPVRSPVGKLKLLVRALARLHNFCINERTAESLVLAEKEKSNHMPSTPHLLDETPIESDDIEQRVVDSVTPNTHKGMSAIREMMVNNVEKLGLERPKPKFYELS
jgi:hypothetical protein